MATHSSVIAWKIPGTGEPGGLPSMGLELDTTEVTQQQQQHMGDKSLETEKYLSVCFPLPFLGGIIILDAYSLEGKL